MHMHMQNAVCRRPLQTPVAKCTCIRKDAGWRGARSAVAAGFDRTAMPAHPSSPVGSAASSFGCRWLTPAVEMAAVASGNWPLTAQPAARGWTRFPRVATRTPGADARSVHAARDFTIATLQRWGTAQRCDDIAIVVSELLTNALRHALPACGQTRPQSAIRLGLLQPGPCVVCAVADPSQAAPIPNDPSLTAETGRGLHVIGALADTWGYTTPSDNGKVVWAIFSIKPGVPGGPRG